MASVLFACRAGVSLLPGVRDYAQRIGSILPVSKDSLQR